MNFLPFTDQVDPEGRGYFFTVIDYIHLNPVRAGMIRPEARLCDHGWSRYPHFVRRSARPGWLKAETVLGELGWKDAGAGRLADAQGMRDRALAAALPVAAEGWTDLRR